MSELNDIYPIGINKNTGEHYVIPGKQFTDENYTLNEKQKLANLSDISSQGLEDLRLLILQEISNLRSSVPAEGDNLNKLNTRLDSLEDILSEGNDLDTVVNRYSEVKKSFENFPEGINLFTLFNTLVKLDGDQTINNIKTFTEFPVLPDTLPIDNKQASNKKYVDSKINDLISSNDTTYSSTYLNTFITSSIIKKDFAQLNELTVLENELTHSNTIIKISNNTADDKLYLPAPSLPLSGKNIRLENHGTEVLTVIVLPYSGQLEEENSLFSSPGAIGYLNGSYENNNGEYTFYFY